jgi:hypothetical protein
MDIIKILGQLLYLLPNIMRIIDHYKELSNSDNLNPQDKEEAKALLSTLRWRRFEDIP